MRCLSLLPGFFGMTAAILHAELHLPRLFDHHMVLQQDTGAEIWGTATPGAVIDVTGSWNQLAIRCQADENGRWQTLVPTPEATPDSPAYTLTVKEYGGETRVFEDVLIGEVWLLSGQSNMELPLQGWPEASPPCPVTGGAETIAAADLPKLRLIAAGRQISAKPLETIAEHWADDRWTAATPESAAGFSAVGYFFGEELQPHLDIPVGLILSCWGGSAIEAWIPEASLRALPDYADAADWAPQGPDDVKTPTLLYNGMIAPLKPFTLRGVLWYQGESNVGQAERYRVLFPTLIRSWREQWSDPRMVFLFAQLAPWGGYGPVSLQELWEAQASALELPGTGMAATIDCGDKDNIHPADKQPIGHRLALLARQEAYGESDLVASGPVCTGQSVEGATLTLTFAQVGGGLVVPENQYTGFELAGPDGVFHPAKAQVRGERIELTSPAVGEPRQARYAWTPTPRASLYNREGLPAAPFRTKPLGQP